MTSQDRIPGSAVSFRAIVVPCTEKSLASGSYDSLGLWSDYAALGEALVDHAGDRGQGPGGLLDHVPSLQNRWRAEKAIPLRDPPRQQ
jgi:hypothetical protein